MQKSHTQILIALHKSHTISSILYEIRFGFDPSIGSTPEQSNELQLSISMKNGTMNKNRNENRILNNQNNFPETEIYPNCVA